MTSSGCNISAALATQAREIPDQPAILVPHRSERITFAELNTDVDRLTAGFLNLGVAKGMRVLVMVPPGIEFTAIAFALFRLGALPVLIDPGLGKTNLLQGIELAQPEVFVGIPKAHAASLVYPKYFRSVRLRITVGTRWLWGGKTLNQVRKAGAIKPGSRETTQSDDPAAILFTSGSTGPAKGVLYTHGMFVDQVECIRKIYNIAPGEIEMPTFPLFALFGTGMGMTCVLPQMDPTCPARVNPQIIFDTVTRYKVTSSFGSPALWNTVSQWCLENHKRLPTLKRILMAGAPVPGSLLKRFDSILEPDAKIFTPYGATESLPVASIERQEILNETWSQTCAGKGTCVGFPVDGVEARIIRIEDDALETWEDIEELPTHEIGEIVVSSARTTHSYFRKEEATRRSKIKKADVTWHRMGDVGYKDERGRLWFCGRKNHRVITAEGTLFTIPCEAVFNTHPQVMRTALVGLGEPGDQIPAVIIEPEKTLSNLSKQEKEKIIAELKEIATKHEPTRELGRFLFHEGFPVDVRHNAKINREALKVWAERTG